MDTNTTHTRKCGRCTGTGYYLERGECFRCNGYGTITVTRRTEAEKAAISARETRIIAARAAVIDFAKTLPDFDATWDAGYGFGKLRDNEPARFEKMLDSIDAGRIAAVTRALIDYWNTPRSDTPEDMVCAVRTHALKPENAAAGWDTITECYTDAEIAEILESHGATTVDAALNSFKSLVDAWEEQDKTAAWLWSY